jgi:hypothetical protein
MTAPWLPDIDGLLSELSKDRGLQPSASGAFDGDSWVWIWREYLDDPMGNDDARVVEARLRSRPDELHDGLQAELFAVASWLKGRRASWSRTCWARYVDPGELSNPQFAQELGAALDVAWRDAHEAAERLIKSPESPRDATLRMLGGTGVVVRKRPRP